MRGEKNTDLTHNVFKTEDVLTEIAKFLTTKERICTFQVINRVFLTAARKTTLYLWRSVDIKTTTWQDTIANVQQTLADHPNKIFLRNTLLNTALSLQAWKKKSLVLRHFTWVRNKSFWLRHVHYIHHQLPEKLRGLEELIGALLITRQATIEQIETLDVEKIYAITGRPTIHQLIKDGFLSIEQIDTLCVHKIREIAKYPELQQFIKDGLLSIEQIDTLCVHKIREIANYPELQQFIKDGLLSIEQIDKLCVHKIREIADYPENLHSILDSATPDPKPQNNCTIL